MTDRCAKCQKATPIDQLDAKPAMTPRLRAIATQQGQLAMLAYAADHGHDFNRLECEACYGPGYCNL